MIIQIYTYTHRREREERDEKERQESGELKEGNGGQVQLEY